MENKEIIEWNIKESQENIKKAILKDNIIIFFTRIIEDLEKSKNTNFYGRIKELFQLIYPYSELEDSKEIFTEIKTSDLNGKQGLALDKEEREYVKFFINNLDEKCRFKNKSEKDISNILTKLVKKYLVNSSKLIEPYLLGKLISSAGGIENIYRKPSSTIQLIGAEKALFRHISKKKPCPKYGLIYYSSNIKNKKNPGKKARTLSNKLALNLRIDYFQNFVPNDETPYDSG